MSRWIWAAACAAVLCVPVGAQAGTQYWVTGHGWGHGIGMSQYGAQGFATKAGFTYDQIIRYYFEGTSLAAAPPDVGTIKALLVDGRSAVSFVAQVDGMTITSEGSSFGANRGDTIVVRVSGGKLKLERTSGGATATDTLQSSAKGPITISGPAGSVAPLQTRFRATSGAANNRYRGEILVHKVGSRISVVNRLPLDEYLLGVVPAEMPTSWHAEALKAQAVAARSYAVATRKPTGIFDAYSDTRSQVYRGYEEEEATSTAAVQATAGIVAYSEGKVIPTFFHSTSGGRTAAIEDVWGSAPRQYLTSRPDPYEVSPYSTWPEHLVYTPRQMAAAFSGYVSGSFRGARVQLNKSQRAGTIGVIGSGGTTQMPASTLQVRLSLRSTFFRIDRLQLDSSARVVAARGKVRLSGFVPTRGRTYLWVRSPGGPWANLGKVVRRRGGAWTKAVRVPMTREFRLSRRGKLGPGVVVRVV